MANLDECVGLHASVRQVLLRRLRAAGRGSREIADGSQLLELGIIDSEDLVEMILEVEEQCDCEFNPIEIDLEAGLTLAGLVRSFAAKA